MAMASRRRYQEALKCLKQAVKNEKLSWVMRVRCVELIYLAYGLSLDGASKRDRQDIRSLVEQDEFTATLREQLQAKSKQDAVAAAKQFLATAGADDVEQEGEREANDDQQ